MPSASPDQEHWAMSTAEGPPPTKAPNNPKPKRPAEEGRQDRRRPPRWTRRRWPRSDLLVGSGHGPGSKAIRLLATHREGPLHRIDARCTRMPSVPCRTNAQVRTRFCASRPGPAPHDMPRLPGNERCAHLRNARSAVSVRPAYIGSSRCPSSAVPSIDTAMDARPFRYRSGSPGRADT